MAFGHDATAPRAGRSRPPSQTPQGRNGVGRVLTAVAIVAVLINGLAFSASHLWVCPDSSYYIALAGGIAERFDLTNELFLIRPPGYPLLLAGIFVVFGSWSPVAILVVQHALVVGVAALTTLIAWHLTSRRSVALLAGLMTACSLQLLAFANVIVTEVPYTFTLVLSVYFLVRYHRSGGVRYLAFASLTAGVACLIRPAGLSVVGICVAAAVYRVWVALHEGADGETPTPTNGVYWRRGSALSKPRGAGRLSWLRRLTEGPAVAVAPALLVVLPFTAVNRLVHGAQLSGGCANLALYHRLLTMDKLDSTNSAALSDIRAVVRQAVRRGDVPAHADYRQWGPVWHAYESVRKVPLVESSAMIGEACRDLIAENIGAVFKNTVRYAYWMLMVPDSFYRFHPGAAPGVRTPTGEYVRNPKADLFEASTYEPLMRPWIAPYHHYLPLATEPTATTSAWREIARWFYTNVDKGRPVVGWGDSPYEEFGWLCLLGIVGSFWVRERTGWLLVLGVILVQVVPSAFFGGPTPRYAVPVNPLMLLYAALLPVMAWRIFAAIRNSAQLARRRRFGFGHA